METHKCEKGCCTIKIKPYLTPINRYFGVKRPHRKAGVFLYDPIRDKVLLIQSRGHLWGPPKGSVKYGETERLCAVREVFEETGLRISEDNFTRATIIMNKSTYFYLEHDVCNVTIKDCIEDNDANGITWIRPECLETLIMNGNITLTHHCRIVFQRFMQRTFPHCRFILVDQKKRCKRF